MKVAPCSSADAIPAANRPSSELFTTSSLARSAATSSARDQLRRSFLSSRTTSSAHIERKLEAANESSSSSGLDTTACRQRTIHLRSRSGADPRRATAESLSAQQIHRIFASQRIYRLAPISG